MQAWKRIILNNTVGLEISQRTLRRWSVNTSWSSERKMLDENVKGKPNETGSYTSGGAFLLGMEGGETLGRDCTGVFFLRQVLSNRGQN